ncbi:hypothetical protein QBC47DRAFT_414984 [Echria macrotheca]|uniref:Uncharacterized protein n=1 Tax=Echria macrotheca TaxID=438768 RepID=A0AAJ0F537_9PEZI|nr:hypothetical protein QBC47DRAFT_414984 [Echria macrotheca]
MSVAGRAVLDIHLLLVLARVSLLFYSFSPPFSRPRPVDVPNTCTTMGLLNLLLVAPLALAHPGIMRRSTPTRLTLSNATSPPRRERNQKARCHSPRARLRCRRLAPPQSDLVRPTRSLACLRLAPAEPTDTQTRRVMDTKMPWLKCKFKGKDEAAAQANQDNVRSIPTPETQDSTLFN